MTHDKKQGFSPTVSVTNGTIDRIIISSRKNGATLSAATITPGETIHLSSALIDAVAIIHAGKEIGVTFTSTITTPSGRMCATASSPVVIKVNQVTDTSIEITDGRDPASP